MAKAILSIVIDEKNGFEIRFKGEHGNELALLGTLPFAQEYLVKKMLNASASYETDISTVENGEEINQHREHVVTKEEAVDFYLEFGQELQKRIQTIHASSDKATFNIDKSLLDKF